MLNFPIYIGAKMSYNTVKDAEMPPSRFWRSTDLDYEKSDLILKKIRIGILIAALLAVIAAAVVLRNEIIPGWHTDGDVKYYVKLPFSRASGIVEIGKDSYFFSPDGRHALLYGWNKFDGYYYWSDADGKIVKGEREIDGEKYYFDEKTGIHYRDVAYILDGKLWYFNDHGFKTFGIVELDGFKFCFSETGNLKKGLQVIDGKTYYFDPKNENMVFGMVTVGSDTYYFGEDGAAVTGKTEIDGIEYEFDENGKMIG